MTVRLFARLREAAGTPEVPLAVGDGATAGSVADEVGARYGFAAANLRIAVNREFRERATPVSPGDEVALIPPVSGGTGEGAVLIEIGPDAIDARRLEAAVVHPGAGAICTFTGVVRDFSRGRPVTHLEYEAFGEMASQGMAEIAGEIARRWPGARVAIAHRTGVLQVGEASVVVAVACPHRAEAIEACHWGIDRLKESVPIWKKEFASDGGSWIEGDELKPR